MGSNIFSKLDLLKAYYNIPIEPKSVPFTNVCCPFGSFNFLKAAFGLCNSGKSFQRLMDEIFSDLPFVFAYIDDILVFSKGPDEHAKHLKIVFERLHNYGLKLNKIKCQLNLRLCN